MHPVLRAALPAALLSFAVACGGSEPAPSGDAPADASADAPAEDDGPKADVGVDLEKKVVRIGALNDESGPAAALGKPYALGKRVLAAQVNAGGSDILPDGWTVELVEKDHGYNPQQSVQAFKEIKDRVLFFATSFGTPNTLPLVPMLEGEGVIAFPASLSSEMAGNPQTPPAGASYVSEARRAMDWIVEQAGDAGAESVKAGIVYQQDDYGKDGLAGWKEGAAKHGVKIVSAQTVAPGQKDMTAVVTALKDAGATHVLLTTLPSATGPILGTAAQLQFGPLWLGNTPSWVDRFFDPTVIPSAVFANYHWITGQPFWGEDVPGMKDFVAAFAAHAGEGAAPDFYAMMSYIQGRVALEAFRMAAGTGDMTRAGYSTSLRMIDGWDLGGMIQPLSYTGEPYVAGTKTRVLKPDFAAKSWTGVAPYAEAK